MKTKMLFITIYVTIMLAFSYQSVSATLGNWDIWAKQNIKGASYGYAGKMVRKLSSVQWAGDIVSYTDYPPVAITLGWTYFTTKETCNGGFVQQTIKPGTAVWKTQIAATTFMSTKSCSGARYGYVLGKHELKGSITWTPEWSHGDPLP